MNSNVDSIWAQTGIDRLGVEDKLYIWSNLIHFLLSFCPVRRTFLKSAFGSTSRQHSTTPVNFTWDTNLQREGAQSTSQSHTTSSKNLTDQKLSRFAICTGKWCYPMELRSWRVMYFPASWSKWFTQSHKGLHEPAGLVVEDSEGAPEVEVAPFTGICLIKMSTWWSAKSEDLFYHFLSLAQLSTQWPSQAPWIDWKPHGFKDRCNGMVAGFAPWPKKLGESGAAAFGLR